MKKTKICETCFQTFEAKNNKGIEQRFCKDQCRNEFHSVGRKYFGVRNAFLTKIGWVQMVAKFGSPP